MLTSMIAVVSRGDAAAVSQPALITRLREHLSLIEEIDAMEQTASDTRRAFEQVTEKVGEVGKRVARISDDLHGSRDRADRALVRVRQLVALAGVLRQRLLLDTFLAGADLQNNLRGRRIAGVLLRQAAHTVAANRDRLRALADLDAGLRRVRASLRERQAALIVGRKAARTAREALAAKVAAVRRDPAMIKALDNERGTLYRRLAARITAFEAWRNARSGFKPGKSLRWPFLPARVEIPFGRAEQASMPAPAAAHREQQSGTIELVQRGVVLRLLRDVSAQGVSVRAVAWGRVSFAGKIPGYGPTVILDHGDGYHGVYAGFDQLRVEQGEVVPPRSPVGFIRPRGTKHRAQHPRIIFELWQRGEPVDPVPWFR